LVQALLLGLDRAIRCAIRLRFRLGREHAQRLEVSLGHTFADIANLDASLVHFHTGNSCLPRSVMIALEVLRHPPVLVTLHSPYETVTPGSSRARFWATMARRGCLDGVGGRGPHLDAVAKASDALTAAEAKLTQLKADAADAAARMEEISLNLADLDVLDPRADEETELAGERAILGAAEKAVADLSDARTPLGGDKLAALGGRFQVLGITHLRQIAASGRTHFLIEKKVQGSRTVTSVTRLTGEDRVPEIARMMGGSAAGVKALESARELIDAAQAKGEAEAKAKGESQRRAKAKPK